MKRKLFLRCLFGAPIGFAISTAITVFISFLIGDGNYYPVIPEFVEVCGNEINAVTLQAVFSMLYGAVWAGASLIWEREDWSLLRQTVTHLLVGSTATFPVAYYCRWMPHNFAGIMSYISIFCFLYFIIWLSIYLSYKNRIRQINREISVRNQKG